jgi:hypothetical protein
MRIDDFDSEWHFVPDRPEAIRVFRRTNRAMILFIAVFVVGVFVAMMLSQPVHNSVTATHLGSTVVHKVKALGPQHPAAPGPQTR